MYAKYVYDSGDIEPHGLTGFDREVNVPLGLLTSGWKTVIDAA